MRAAGVVSADEQVRAAAMESPTLRTWVPDWDEPVDGEAVDVARPLDRAAMPPWAEGMEPEDLRRGIDPLSGRPLEW
jgi:hypothetical protein